MLFMRSSWWLGRARGAAILLIPRTPSGSRNRIGPRSTGGRQVTPSHTQALTARRPRACRGRRQILAAPSDCHEHGVRQVRRRQAPAARRAVRRRPAQHDHGRGGTSCSSSASAAWRTRPAGAASAARTARACRPRRRDSALSPVRMPEAVQRERRHPVARRRRVVVPGLGRLDQPLVVVAGEEEAAAFAVLEALQQRARRARCANSRSSRAEIGLQHLEQRSEQEGVVVEVGVEMRAAVLVRARAAAVLPHRGADEVERAARRVEPVGAAERARGARHAARSSARSSSRAPSRRGRAARACRAPRTACARAVSSSSGTRPRRGRARAATSRSGSRDDEMPVPALEVGRPVEAVVRRDDARTPRASAARGPRPASRRRTCPPRARSRRRATSSSRLRATASRASPTPRSPRRRARRAARASPPSASA